MMRIFLAAMFAFFTAVGTAHACAPLGMDRAALETLKAAKFEISSPKKRARFALELVDCLDEKDPALRDGVGFEGLASLLRSGAIDDKTKRALMKALLSSLAAPEDADGVRRPFAALALSEVARADRVAPFLTDAERASLVDAATQYVRGVEDYRGFENEIGWRHGVAHGADWLMQLALNPKVTRAQLDAILAAVAAKVAPSGHSYVFGEPQRLARPVLYAALRAELAGEDWPIYLGKLADPAPLANWSDAFRSRDALSRLHNLKAFLSVLYIAAATSEEEALAPLAQASVKTLGQLP